MLKEGSATPWGAVQILDVIAPGIVQVHTAEHGGIHLDPEWNRKVHAAWRQPNAWYEEDCAAQIVKLTFPQHFPAEHITLAHNSAKNYFPSEYGKVFKTTVAAVDSVTVARDEFGAAHASDLVATAAWGHRNDRWGRYRVPEGWVGVVATIGGKRTLGVEERWFLVTDEAYRDTTRFGMVIDPAVWSAWPELPEENDDWITVQPGSMPRVGRREAQLFPVAKPHFGKGKVGKLWLYPGKPDTWLCYREGRGAMVDSFLTAEEALHSAGFRLAPYAEVPTVGVVDLDAWLDAVLDAVMAQ